MPRPRKTVKSVSDLPIAIIGGGPAGTAAALAAVKKYSSVILYDKNPLPAKKISFAGGNALTVAEKLPADEFMDCCLLVSQIRRIQRCVGLHW